MDRLLPTVIDRLTSVVLLLFTWNPVPDVTNDNGAPVVATLYAPDGPPSVIARPEPTVKYRLLARPACAPTVKNVCVKTGELAIAAVVVCTVTPFWTTGTNSVPVSVCAVGSCVIAILAIMV